MLEDAFLENTPIQNHKPFNSEYLNKGSRLQFHSYFRQIHLDQPIKYLLIDQSPQQIYVVIYGKDVLDYLDQHSKGFFFIKIIYQICYDFVEPLAVPHPRISSGIRLQYILDLVELNVFGGVRTIPHCPIDILNYLIGFYLEFYG
jgi:hypothetical protein